MAGHSQFKNIMHRKGKQDAMRSKMFGKLAREITVAAKLGTPDPAMNPRLRLAITAARAENMPKDNIERAIKKAIGSDGENYDEIRYEGYGPGGVAVIVEALTDNRNRAASDIRSYFTKSGGNLGETGSVSFMFDRVGVIEYDAKVASDDAMLEAAIEAQHLAPRLLGSCALSLMFVATGRLRGFLEPRVGGLWDVAGGLALCRAAGVPTAFKVHPDGTVDVLAGQVFALAEAAGWRGEILNES